MAMPGGIISPWGQARRRRLDAEQPGRRVRRRLAVRVPRAYVPRNVQRVPRFPPFYADQPHRKFAKLKYCVHEYLAGPAANALNVVQYRANGMYDPEVAIGGHQPAGFDSLMEQYLHFTVLSATIDVEMQNATLANNIIAYVCLNSAAGQVAALYAAAPAGQGNNTIREQPFLSKDLITSVYSSFRQDTRSTRLSFNASKFFGKSPWNLIGDSRFQGSDSADPTEDANISLVLYSPTYANESGHSFPFKVVITYNAVFTEPRRTVIS